MRAATMPSDVLAMNVAPTHTAAATMPSAKDSARLDAAPTASVSYAKPSTLGSDVKRATVFQNRMDGPVAS